jgi:polyisoprenoid-binding protein YceI
VSTTEATTTTPIPTGTWVVDPAHSQVGFSVKHMGISNVRGSFGEFEGKLDVGSDLASSKITGTVKAATVSTDWPQRDDHLRSPDFFDVENHPEIAFESTRIEEVDSETLRITGNLTMHGVTKEISLDAVVDGTETDPMGNERAGLEVAGQISRGDFGMKFNQALGSGNVAVSDKVKIALDISAIKQS